MSRTKPWRFVCKDVFNRLLESYVCWSCCLSLYKSHNRQENRHVSATHPLTQFHGPTVPSQEEELRPQSRRPSSLPGGLGESRLDSQGGASQIARCGSMARNRNQTMLQHRSREMVASGSWCFRHPLGSVREGSLFALHCPCWFYHRLSWGV